MTRRSFVWILLAACALVSTKTTSTHAGNPLVVFPESPERLPAVRYSALTASQCHDELVGRSIPFSKGPPVPTIDAPVRLEGPLHGVSIEFSHRWVPKHERGPVMDCRLLVALDDFASVVSSHRVAKVHFNSVYRGTWARVPGQRHAAGVAIDVTELVLDDGMVLNIERDFGGAGVGAKTCGEGAAVPEGDKATALRRIVCDVDGASMFNLVLTPHYDRRHQDHLHLEVRRGIDWFLTQ